MPRSSRAGSIAFVAEVARFLRIEPADVLHLIQKEKLPATEVPKQKRSVLRISLVEFEEWIGRKSEREIEYENYFKARNGDRDRQRPTRPTWPSHEIFLHDFTRATQTQRAQILTATPAPARRAFALKSEICRFLSVLPEKLDHVDGWRELPRLSLRMPKIFVDRIPLREVHAWLQSSLGQSREIKSLRRRNGYVYQKRDWTTPPTTQPVPSDYETFLDYFDLQKKTPLPPRLNSKKEWDARHSGLRRRPTPMPSPEQQRMILDAAAAHYAATLNE